MFQAYSHTTQKTDDREKIHWVQFQQADINSIHTNPDYDAQSVGVAPLLLLIGYTNGVQIWAIPANGEAQEVMSVRQGPIRFLKVLPTPLSVSGCHDLFASKRPLLAVCDASSAGQPYCSVKFLSLRTGDEVHNIAFKLPVADIQCNERVIVVAFTEKIAAFDALDLKEKFCVTSCYPCPGPNPNPIALGTRWLAYADKKLVPVHQSCGGMTGDGRQSYAATVISAAKTITKGLTIFGETVASSLTGMKSFPTHSQKETVDNEGCRPGVVTIIDIENVGKGQISVQDDCDGEGLIAHFPAHATEPVAAVKFDPSGTMLLTTDRLGHNFHLFRLMAHPWSCSLGAVHHLYTLHRGDTTAKVQDISFTLDSRWVAISTLHGTTHIFPVTPYGGSVNVRTHTSQRVVNRASRFHRSAGLDDIDTRLTDRDSPVPVSGSPGSSPGQHPDQLRHLLHQNAINNSMGNPRLPPYPHPTTTLPLVQIKQSLSIPGLAVPGARTGTGSKSKCSLVPPGGASECVCVAVCWGPSRGWVAGSPNVSRDKSDKRAVDSLFVISWTGNLIEYVLDPHMKNSTEKLTDDSQLEVTATPRAQWTLIRSISTSELRPPLSPNNVVVLATDAVLTQRPSAELMGTLARQESRESLSSDHSSSRDDQDDQWLSQVEILTHSEPHRRLWMGPQFSFKTFQGSNTTTVLSSTPLSCSLTRPTHTCLPWTTTTLTFTVSKLHRPARAQWRCLVANVHTACRPAVMSSAGHLYQRLCS
ncbi:hypothetical protein NP493_899g00031 [Ridgeia piscesae]|uniref:BCAS3 microtubule associated cell migration factor n=1 Tax=Ridgeia piscesae TaxID=27915 RepID=A0AAD9KL47_RIDPI|nr:hypothetical protein NP493_899g00031 [Ridgeia piscesae]